MGLSDIKAFYSLCMDLKPFGLGNYKVNLFEARRGAEKCLKMDV